MIIYLIFLTNTLILLNIWGIIVLNINKLLLIIYNLIFYSAPT